MSATPFKRVILRADPEVRASAIFAAGFHHSIGPKVVDSLVHAAKTGSLRAWNRMNYKAHIIRGLLNFYPEKWRIEYGEELDALLLSRPLNLSYAQS